MVLKWVRNGRVPLSAADRDIGRPTGPNFWQLRNVEHVAGAGRRDLSQVRDETAAPTGWRGRAGVLSQARAARLRRMQRRDGARLTAGQRDYLIGHLAGRRDWAGLWRLVQDLPLASAVAAVRWLNDGWSPADEGGRALLRRLARADPDAIATAGQALAAPTAVSIDLDDVPTHGCCGGRGPDRYGAWATRR